MTLAQTLLALYGTGAAVALARTDGGWGTRVLLALLWPLAPVAFLATVTALLAVAMVAFPMFGAAVLALAGTAWLLR